MFQPLRDFAHPASYYHRDLVRWRLEELGWSDRNLAGITELSHTLIGQALDGDCKKMSTLWPIAKALGLKWDFLFRLDLPKSEFRRAVEDGA